MTFFEITGNNCVKENCKNINGRFKVNCWNCAKSKRISLGIGTPHYFCSYPRSTALTKKNLKINKVFIEGEQKPIKSCRETKKIRRKEFLRFTGYIQSRAFRRLMHNFFVTVLVYYHVILEQLNLLVPGRVHPEAADVRSVFAAQNAQEESRGN